MQSRNREDMQHASLLKAALCLIFQPVLIPERHCLENACRISGRICQICRSFLSDFPQPLFYALRCRRAFCALLCVYFLSKTAETDSLHAVIRSRVKHPGIGRRQNFFQFALQAHRLSDMKLFVFFCVDQKCL